MWKTVDKKGEPGGAEGVTDQQHALLIPCLHVIPHNLTQVARNLGWFARLPEILQAVEADGRYPHFLECISEVPVEIGPSTVAGEDDRQNVVLRIGSRQFNQRELPDMGLVLIRRQSPGQEIRRAHQRKHDRQRHEKRQA